MARSKDPQEKLARQVERLGKKLAALAELGLSRKQPPDRQEMFVGLAVEAVVARKLAKRLKRRKEGKDNGNG